MSKTCLLESASTLTKSGARWSAVLAKPGQGSSGYYSEDVLREYGPKALAPGAKAFVNHDPERNPKDMIGTYPDGATYVEGVGLVGELEVFPHWQSFVETVGPHAGLSIYMMGESDEDGNITALLPDVQNGVDLVSYPGLEGSGLVEKLYESAKTARSEKTSVTSAQEKKEGNMDEVLRAVEALSTKFDTFVTESKNAAAAAVKAEADADAIETAKTEAVEAAIASYDEKITAIDAVEDLLPSQVESLRKAAKRGDDVAPLIEAAKSIVDEAKQTLTESGSIGRGRVVTGSDSRSFAVEGFRA